MTTDHRGATAENVVATTPLRFGFRRRCGWCGVVLRGWQLNLCRRCKERVSLSWADPWTVSKSRWDDQPDEWRWLRPHNGRTEAQSPGVRE